METLVVVADHRNQCYSRNSYGSSPSRGFRQINCRAFDCGGGLLPTPIKICSVPLSDGILSSPKTPTPIACASTPNYLKSDANSCRVFIDFEDGKKEGPQNHNSPFSELWAGPAYSNSPPPSSLPIPKFSKKPKRSASLELPRRTSDIAEYLAAKSAPASPTRITSDDDSATMMLRRILNLDVADDLGEA